MSILKRRLVRVAAAAVAIIALFSSGSAHALIATRIVGNANYIETGSCEFTAKTASYNSGGPGVAEAFNQAGVFGSSICEAGAFSGSVQGSATAAGSLGSFASTFLSLAAADNPDVRILANQNSQIFDEIVTSNSTASEQTLIFVLDITGKISGLAEMTATVLASLPSGVRSVQNKIGNINLGPLPFTEFDFMLNLFAPLPAGITAFELRVALQTKAADTGFADFSDSAFLSVILPPGVTITTGSGLLFSQPADAVSAVPLPAALPLFLSALAGLGLMGWRRRQADA